MALTASAVRPSVPTRSVSRRGSVTSLALLAVGLVTAAALSLAVGSRDIPLGDVIAVLLQPTDGEIATIVWQLRLPRTLLGIAVGAALGIGGALMQGHTHNALADPGLLGVSAGAAFAVVIGIFAFGVTNVAGYTWFALAGAGIAAAAVFAIGSTRGGPSPVTLVLAGAAVSALLESLTQGIIIADVHTLDEYRFWAVGSVAGRDLDVLFQVLPFLLAGLVLSALSVPGLNLLQLGDDVATSLGVHPARQRVIGIGAVMLLTGAATAACGPIAFVGLVVPHLARHLGGVDYRWVAGYSGFLGALLLVLADIVGRVLVRPGELQVGIVMALIGGPAFVVLVRRTRLGRL